jgi:hypothetical protein
MTLYLSQEPRTYQRRFRIFGLASILLLLGICLFSFYEPQGLSHSMNVALAGAAGAIVLGTIVLALFMSAKNAMWKAKHTFQWELDSERIIQRHESGRTREIPLVRIESLNDYRGWLIVKGGEPLERIAVPSDVDGFEELKRSLGAHCAITPLKTKFSILRLLIVISGIVTYVLLFTSHILAVIVIAGCNAILFQGWSLYLLRRVWQAKSMSLLVVATYILTSLMIVWIVLLRTKAAM